MKDKLFDHLQKLNWTFFIMIVILIILLFFASTIKYVFVKDTEHRIAAETQTSIKVEIKENTVREFYGALRPIVSAEARVNSPSVITFNLKSDKYETSFSTPGYTTSFEKVFFIPPEAHSTKFELVATARDKGGEVVEEVVEFETKKVLMPKFNIS